MADELGEGGGGGLPLSVREQSRLRKRQEAAARGAEADGAEKSQRKERKGPGAKGEAGAAPAAAAPGAEKDSGGGAAFDHRAARSLLPKGGGVALLQGALEEQAKVGRCRAFVTLLSGEPQERAAGCKELTRPLPATQEEAAAGSKHRPKKRTGVDGRGAGAAAGGKKKERWQFDGRPDFDAEPFKAGPRSKVRRPCSRTARPRRH